MNLTIRRNDPVYVFELNAREFRALRDVITLDCTIPQTLSASHRDSDIQAVRDLLKNFKDAIDSRSA